MAEQKKRANANTKKSTGTKKEQPKKTQNAAKTARETALDPAGTNKMRSEIVAIVMVAVGIFLAIALQTKIAGVVGKVIGDGLKGLFGFGALFLPYFLIVFGVLMLFGATRRLRGSTVCWMIVLYLSMDLLNAARFVKDMDYGILGYKEVYQAGVELKNGGLFGMYAGAGLFKAVGMAGLYIVAIALLIISLLILLRTPLSNGLERAKIRKDKRKERKEEQRAIEAEEAAKRAEMEKEFAEKRKAYDDAGRQMEMTYHAPSTRANAFATPKEVKTADEEKAPKKFFGTSEKKPLLRSEQYKKLSANQQNILDMVTNENFDEKTTPQKGFGLADGDGASLRQPRRNIVLTEEPVGGMQTPEETIELESAPTPDRPSVYNEDINLTGEAPEGTDFVGFPETDEKPGSVSADSGVGDRPHEAVTESVTTPAAPGQTAAAQTASDAVTTPSQADSTQDTDAQKPATASQEPAKPAAQETEKPASQGTKSEPAHNAASVATAASATESSDSDVKVTPKRRGTYTMPFFNLLDETKSKAKTQSRQELNQRAELLEQTLASFGVEAEVKNVISGPSVTRYEIEPGMGVKVSRITNLADDLALNMRARSIRIEAPIPGKAAVGIEIENEDRQMIGLREIIQSDAFKNHKSKLAFAVGKDIGGNAVVADLAKMPHMLIAGATGSGKSVCINSIIISLLYKANPDEVKMLLVDPKMVELGNYNGIPHLMHPVVTDANKAAAALQWAVVEMTERYKKFAAAGVKDLGSYNSKMKEDGDTDEILPQIVIIIDELADLMMVASSQVEDAICRLAQLARAAGMHMILATQRPSVDVITGLIKANIPSRIAFMVTSQVDSRTIIDMVGAEKLVGNGDMLFKPADLNKPKRIQGPFVSDKEIERVLTHVRNQHIDPEYNEAITAIKSDNGGGAPGAQDEGDELLNDAIELVISSGQASISGLQRRFRVGYNRAARMVDMMEEKGIIGPPDGSKPRQVLITEAQWEQMKNDGN